MNKLEAVFQKKDKEVMAIYFTAGYPQLDDTAAILHELQSSGADIVEVGIPYSDPLADGPTIQASSSKALENGMNLDLLFRQLEAIKSEIHVPVVLMGYLNPILQYGPERFCRACRSAGVSGVILPDLPLEEYKVHWEECFRKYGLLNVFLVTPQTSPARFQELEAASGGFLYVVSSASTTGAKTGIADQQKAYFERLQQTPAQKPRLIGFGISDRKTFQTASQYANGAIIGSAFIKALEPGKSLRPSIRQFITQLQ